MGTKKIGAYTKGQRVAIINRTFGGIFVIEGFALVIGKSPVGSDQFRVQFETGSLQIVERFIDPAAQADPYDFVSRLNLQAREAAGGVS